MFQWSLLDWDCQMASSAEVRRRGISEGGEEQEEEQVMGNRTGRSRWRK
jgi:hypothetical protein